MFFALEQVTSVTPPLAMEKVHFLFILLSLQFYPTVDTVPAKQIFTRPSANNYTCKVIYPSFLSMASMYAPLKTLFDTLTKRINNLNCTVSLQELFVLGEPNDRGEYNGAIGMIQRHEFTGAVWPFRPDSLPHEPALIGSVWMSGDASMVTRKKPRYPLVRDVMSVFIDIGRLMYVYTSYVVVIATVIMVLAWIVYRSKEAYWLLTVRAVYDIFWVLFGIRHPSLRRSSLTRKVLITSMSLFGFAFIIGFLQNRVGSDLCILFGERDIDSIEDLLEEPSVLPWVSPRLFLFNILKAAPVGTKTNLIWQRIMQTPDQSIEKVVDQRSVTTSLGPTISSLMQRTSEGKIAILIVLPIARAARQFSCLFQREFAVKTTIARHTFAHGYLSVIWSHLTDKARLRGLNYIFSNMFEGHLFLGAIKTSKLTSPLPGMAEANEKTIACQEGLVDEQLDWYPFNLYLFKGTFGLLISGLAVSFFLLICEKIYFRAHLAKLSKRRESSRIR